MNKNIAILLASYNGKKWIKEQIDSILNQKEVNLSIFVSDDFSTDNTLEYLKELYKEEKRLFFLESKEKFGGAAKNFYRLINDVDFTNFDYVALADQDDIWFEDKLIRAINVIKDKNVSGYSGNVLAFWENGEEKLINKAQKQIKFDYLFEAAGPGCTYVLTLNLALEFQKFLKANFEKVNEILSHDWLIYAFSRVCDYKWHIDNIPKIKYRQHQKNQVGANYGVNAIFKRTCLIFSSWYRSETKKMIILFNLESKINFSNLILCKNYYNNLLLLRYVFYFRRKYKEKLFLFLMVVLNIY